jgi:amphi-Trp domain-containing protein
MELLETETEEKLRREAAADKLRQIADMLSKHNEVSFMREGLRYTAKVPNEVTYSLEIELTDTGGELEIELKW